VEPVSPAPAAQIHEPTMPGVEELGKSILIGSGVALATLGLGVIALPLKAALLISGGTFAGSTIIAHASLKENKLRKLRFQVSPAPSSQVHYPTFPRVEES